MSKRVALNLDDLDSVVGGAIVWKPDGTCYDKSNPDIKYHFDVYQIDDILAYLKENNGGGAYNLQSLEMLKEAGYVW